MTKAVRTFNSNIGGVAQALGLMKQKDFEKIADPLKLFAPDPSVKRAEQAAAEADRLQKQAAETAAKTAQAQADAATAMQNLQSNQAADLSGSNVAQVIAGGSADKYSEKKRRKTAGLASTLGINA